MFRKVTALILLCVVLASSGALALSQDNPTIAILRIGSMASHDITEGAILDVLESYGFISAEENRILEERNNHHGAALNVIWGDAGFDIPTVNLMVENALDQDVDLLVTLSTPVTQVAVNMTADMDDPIPVLFTSVYTPYEAGIADSACIKPNHVTGSETHTSYEYVFSALLMQNPDMERIGTIFDTGSSSGAFGAEQILDIGEAHGLTVDTAGVTGFTDLRVAAESLADSGAEAIVLPIDHVTTQGLPIIVTVANENGVPVFHPSFSSIYYGATVGAGASPFYEQGVNVGRMLAAHLNGDLNTASTAINVTMGAGIGINLDSANLQGVEISDELMQEAVAVIQGGRPTRLAPAVLAAIARRGVVVPLEERLEDDMAWLESLQCTEGMIAEQQAALDAASE